MNNADESSGTRTWKNPDQTDRPGQYKRPTSDEPYTLANAGYLDDAALTMATSKREYPVKTFIYFIVFMAIYLLLAAQAY